MTGEWQVVSGELPDELNLDDPPGEDVVQYRSPDGRVTLDVGWYPAFDPRGCFGCCVVIDGNWSTVTRELRTRDLWLVKEWLTACKRRYARGPL